MRVLQLIDSIEAGGAERMAITIANSLESTIEVSAIAVTRKEGGLKESISDKLIYSFINKKSTFDIRALIRLRRLIKLHKIDVVHAHTTSYFFATMLKIVYPKIRIIWHEHQGNRVNSNRWQNKTLYICSFFFDSILVVNEELLLWCQENLVTKKVTYMPNFVDDESFLDQDVIKEKMIICLANLKHPKNHMNLLKAFEGIHSNYPEWKLRFIGMDYQDEYSMALKSFIKEKSLADSVEIVGSIDHVEPYLRHAAIGVLSSDFEGLPMSLLEYGASRMAVIATNVGYCEQVISTFGKIVQPRRTKDLATAIRGYIVDEPRRYQDAFEFNKHIESTYSLNAVLPQLIQAYKN